MPADSARWASSSSSGSGRALAIMSSSITSASGPRSAERTPPRGAQGSCADRSPSVRKQVTEVRRFRRSLVLVGLTVVAPGSAQVTAGNRRLGWAVLSAWIGLVVVGGLVLWLVPMDELAGLAVRPWVLRALKLFLVAALIGWVALLIDAWRLSYPPALTRRHRLVLTGTTLLLSVLVAIPPVLAVRYASAAHEAVTELFPSGEAAAASDGRLNVLLLGTDAAKGRSGVRPDSITVVSVDVRTGAPLLVSLPRNLEKARFTEGSAAAKRFSAGFTGEGERSEWLLNATWTYGEANPELFPGPAEPGLTAVKQAVEGTLGLPIQYVVVVDLNGFQGLVDALGGVTIRVTDPLPIGESGKVLKPGLRKLSGYETLWYARFCGRWTRPPYCANSHRWQRYRSRSSGPTSRSPSCRNWWTWPGGPRTGR